MNRIGEFMVSTHGRYYAGLVFKAFRISAETSLTLI